MHIDESILDADNKIDQAKFNLVARLGGDWYCKIDTENLFKVAKPNIKIGIGVDAFAIFYKQQLHTNGQPLGTACQCRCTTGN